jgi:peptidoglycan/xylan/chitin deacetylase (PgdA/CDA1 family)
MASAGVTRASSSAGTREGREGAEGCFRTTHGSRVLEELGVPLATGCAGPPGREPLIDCARLWLPAGEQPRELVWVRADEPPQPLVKGAFQLGTIPIFGHVLPDAAARELLAGLPERWLPELPIVDRTGVPVAAVWRADDGSTFLPFDPDELDLTLLSEAYLESTRSALATRADSASRSLYYSLRPLIPRRLQIAMRRVHGRVRAGASFPRSPIEPARHDLHGYLLEQLARIGDRPVPYIASWPRGHSWAFVLTHDVETAVGHDNVHLLREVEERAGFRSSWNFVPERYPVDEQVLASLGDGGCEIGVHGLRHDGRDLESLSTLRKRLPKIRQAAERWGAVGFRAPATQRGWDLIPELGFEYDSSYPDSDPYEPQRGGCCSWLPFFNRETVELPITLLQDHTLFVILGRPDATAWLEKLELLRRTGGMALLITHPDYMLDPARLDAYARLLERAGSHDDVWRALPREVSAWWRRRAASRLELVAGQWRVAGPASADAEIRFFELPEVAA